MSEIIGMAYTSDGAHRTDRPFDAEEFVEFLNRGVFEGRLTEQIEKLSYEQFADVARLMAKTPK